MIYILFSVTKHNRENRLKIISFVGFHKLLFQVEFLKLLDYIRLIE